MVRSRQSAQQIINGRGYNLLIAFAAYVAVFLEPVIVLVDLLSESPGQLPVKTLVLVTEAITTLLFAADFILNFRARGSNYLKFSSSWINILVVIDFVGNFIYQYLPFDPLILRILRTTGVVARLGLLQKAGRLESNLASEEFLFSNEDDIKYSLILLLGFTVLAWGGSEREYISVWDPIIEMLVYGTVIIAVRYKVIKNWERVVRNVIEPLHRISEDNKQKLVSLLGEEHANQINKETLAQLAKEGKNEIDFIVEQMDVLFEHIKKFVSDRTWRESRGEVVIPPEQPIAMTFTDVEGFTQATQAMQAAVIPVLGMYLEKMCEGILRYGGDIEKFIGDAVFSYHYCPGDPAQSVNQSFDSLLATTDGVAKLEGNAEWNALFARDGWERFRKLKTRYGMHYGTVTAGPIGSMANQDRVESTLMGDNVNITARLESLTKKYGIYYLMSEDYYRDLSPDRQERCRLVDFITVKGRAEGPFRVYTLDLVPKSREFLDCYHQGQEKYFEGDWNSAMAYFKKAAVKDPEDGPTLQFINRIETTKKYGQMALDHLGRRKLQGIDQFDSIRSQLEKEIESEPFQPPRGFVERKGYWKWEEK